MEGEWTGPSKPAGKPYVRKATTWWSCEVTANLAHTWRLILVGSGTWAPIKLWSPTATTLLYIYVKHKVCIWQAAIFGSDQEVATFKVKETIATVRFPAAVCCYEAARGRHPFDKNGRNFNWLRLAARQNSAKVNTC